MSNVSHVNRTHSYHVVLPYMEIQANESLFSMHIDSPVKHLFHIVNTLMIHFKCFRDMELNSSQIE